MSTVSVVATMSALAGIGDAILGVDLQFANPVSVAEGYEQPLRAPVRI